MTVKSKIPLGQLLIEKKLITQDQLDIALKKQRESGKLLGSVLLELGFVDEETVFLPILAGQMGMEYANLNEKEIPREVITKITAKIAGHYKMIPIDFKNGVLTIATANPGNVTMMDEISLVSGLNIHPVLTSEKDIIEAIRHYYGVGAETIEQMMDSMDVDLNVKEQVANIEDDSEASISKFLNQILLEAYKDRASDIHIEPFEDELQIRYRVDGILYDAKVPASIKHFKDSINSRIKILSNLNIAEKRLPQDGRFKVRMGKIDLDLRVSFLPTPYGESVVLRILNSTRLYSLNDLGLLPEEKQAFEKLLEKPHGIVFLTGPTGSGKTTTLYSCLATLNTEDNKIITIEDPVEYQLKGITQIQINPAIGLNFVDGLRSMLRHDPDIMMVGEVRDKETADIAIQSALTGHLIFSTLHTNDASTGVTRLLDMGVDPYLVTSTVECFIAQRLVRLICSKCKEEIKQTPELMKDFESFMKPGEQVTLFQGKGCEACNFTGFIGREPIYEILFMNETIRDLVMQRRTASEIKEQAMKNGMRSLAQSGWLKVRRGSTSPQEVLRVTQEEMID
jgi:type IV pilus assembly protein PilB